MFRQPIAVVSPLLHVLRRFTDRAMALPADSLARMPTRSSTETANSLPMVG